MLASIGLADLPMNEAAVPEAERSAVIAVIAYLVAASIAATSTGLVPVEREVVHELAFGDRGTAVATLNEGLTRAGFHAEEGDAFGKKTRHAVYAFQKLHGLSTTGRFTAFMWDLLTETPDLPERPEADRIEIDLDRQVLYVVEDQQVVLIVPVSSGSGNPYVGSNGRLQIANTPEGVFRFQRRIRGLRQAPLGTLYNPYYFLGGIALHGSPSVPNYPASHGCVRVTMWDMDLLLNYLEVGQTIYVYGGETSPPAATPSQSSSSFF